MKFLKQYIENMLVTVFIRVLYMFVHTVNKMRNEKYTENKT